MSKNDVVVDAREMGYGEGTYVLTENYGGASDQIKRVRIWTADWDELAMRVQQILDEKKISKFNLNFWQIKGNRLVPTSKIRD